MINLNFLIYKLYRPTESESWEERWDLFLDVSQVDDLGLGTTEQYRRLFKPWILSTWYSRKLSWKPGFVAVQLWEKHLSVSELHTCLAELWYKTTARKGPNVGTSLVVQWQRSHLSMQGTQVQSLAWGDSTCCRATEHACHNSWSPCALEPVLCNKISHCTHN